MKLLTLGGLFLLLISCTATSAPREFDSAEELRNELVATNQAWECDDSFRGPIARENEELLQCVLDGENATVHVLTAGQELPAIRKTDNGPHVWWVSGPNWYLATTSEELTDDIQAALGGTVSTSRP